MKWKLLLELASMDSICTSYWRTTRPELAVSRSISEMEGHISEVYAMLKGKSSNNDVLSSGTTMKRQ